MLYLITFKIGGFAEVKITQKETDYALEGYDGKRIYKVTGGRTFEYLLHDYHPEAYRLNELDALNPFGCVIINHTTVLVRWEDSIEDLESKIIPIFANNDKYFIMAVSEDTLTNLFSKEELGIIFNLSQSR